MNTTYVGCIRTSVSDRRTFPDLRSICSGYVTTYVGIMSFHPSGVDKWVASWIRCLPLQVALSGERSQVRGRYGVVCRGNPVWSIPERLEVKFHEKRYTSTLYLYLLLAMDWRRWFQPSLVDTKHTLCLFVSSPSNPEGLTALWVGNVLPDVPEKTLLHLFSQ